MRSIKAFTLVELMIVIAILGILATALFSSSHLYIERSKRTGAQVSIADIKKMVFTAQVDSDGPIIKVTGNVCTDCSCRLIFGNTVLSGSCITTWTGAITKLAKYSGNNPSRYYSDPWGYPFLLNENDMEPSTPPSECNTDTIRSYGYVKSLGYLPPASYEQIPKYGGAPDPCIPLPYQNSYYGTE